MYISRGSLKLTYILHHIVSKCILHKLNRMRGDLLDQLDFLDTRSVVDASLQDTAAVSVSANRNAVLPDGVKYKLDRH